MKSITACIPVIIVTFVVLGIYVTSQGSTDGMGWGRVLMLRSYVILLIQPFHLPQTMKHLTSLNSLHIKTVVKVQCFALTLLWLVASANPRTMY